MKKNQPPNPPPKNENGSPSREQRQARDFSTIKGNGAENEINSSLPSVSLFTHFDDKTPTTRSLEEVMWMVSTSTTYLPLVEEIRAIEKRIKGIREEDEYWYECEGAAMVVELEAKKKGMKANLPFVTFGGVFSGGRKLANGHYVVPFYSERKVVELDGNGTVVREVPVAGNPSGIAPLRNGHWVVTNGDGHQVLEIAPDGKTVWQLSENVLTGNPIRFAIGVQRLPNGNTVFCNWLGHGHIGKNPHVYEVTPDKQLVWSYEDHQLFKSISQIQVLDEVALGKPWELER
jgi:hypothetical protein